jgi:hypothetical protein
VSLHGKKGLSKKDTKGWCCDKILVHYNEYGPNNIESKRNLHNFKNSYYSIMTNQKNVMHWGNFQCFLE